MSGKEYPKEHWISITEAAEMLIGCDGKPIPTMLLNFLAEQHFSKLTVKIRYRNGMPVPYFKHSKIKIIAEKVNSIHRAIKKNSRRNLRNVIINAGQVAQFIWEESASENWRHEKDIKWGDVDGEYND